MSAHHFLSLPLQRYHGCSFWLVADRRKTLDSRNTAPAPWPGARPSLYNTSHPVSSNSCPRSSILNKWIERILSINAAVPECYPRMTPHVTTSHDHALGLPCNQWSIALMPHFRPGKMMLQPSAFGVLPPDSIARNSPPPRVSGPSCLPPNPIIPSFSKSGSNYAAWYNIPSFSPGSNSNSQCPW